MRSPIFDAELEAAQTRRMELEKIHKLIAQEEQAWNSTILRERRNASKELMELRHRIEKMLHQVMGLE